MNKEEIWKYYTEQVDLLKDALGMTVDEKIKPLVIGLNANKITTSGSCGGHKSRGVLFPWVMCSPLKGKPNYRWKKEKSIKEKIIKKYNITSGSIFLPKNKEAEMEYYEQCHKLGETKEYKKWYQKIKPFEENMEKILNEFYKNRTGKIKSLIVLDREIFENAIYKVPSDKIEKKIRKNCTRKQFIIELQNAQKEIKLFANFLKNKFFNSK